MNAQEDEEVESYAEFWGNAEQWHCGYLVRKVNARSKYVWTETRFQNSIMVRMHEVNENGNTKDNRSVYRELQVDLAPLYTPYDMPGM